MFSFGTQLHLLDPPMWNSQQGTKSLNKHRDNRRHKFCVPQEIVCIGLECQQCSVTRACVVCVFCWGCVLLTRRARNGVDTKVVTDLTSKSLND